MKKLIFILILFITSCYQPEDYYLREEASEITIEVINKAEYVPRIAKYLVVHCIATDPAFPWSVDRLKNFFTIELRWIRYGYNYYITQNGTIWDLTPIDDDIYVDYDELTYGVKGYNSVIWGISLEGGVRRVGNKLVIEDNFTEEQRLSLIYLTQKIKGFHPDVEIIGHNELNNKKACPVLNIDFLD